MVTPFLFSASQKIKISAYADKDKANHIFSGRMKGGDMKIIRSRIVNLRESLLAKSFQLLAEARLRREGLPSGKPLFTYLGAVYHKINKDAIGSVEKWAGHYILR